jgi:hypothetical protein
MCLAAASLHIHWPAPGCIRWPAACSKAARGKLMMGSEQASAQSNPRAVVRATSHSGWLARLTLGAGQPPGGHTGGGGWVGGGHACQQRNKVIPGQQSAASTIEMGVAGVTATMRHFCFQLQYACQPAPPTLLVLALHSHHIQQVVCRVGVGRAGVAQVSKELERSPAQRLCLNMALGLSGTPSVGFAEFRKTCLYYGNKEELILHAS